MDKKNTMLLTVVAVATLLVAVVGATFAFFTAQNTASGSTTVTTTTETIGAVTVSNPTPAMKIKLAAADMDEQSATTPYWATATAANYVTTAEHAVVGQLGVDGGVDATVYECSYFMNIVKPELIKAEDMAIIFTTVGDQNTEVSIENVTSGQEIDLFNAKSSYKVSFTRTGDTGETGVDLVKVAVRLTNRNAEQNYFAGQTMITSVTNDGMTCTIAD